MKCSPACKHPKLAKLKEPVKVLPIYSQDDIFKFAKWKPSGYLDTRLQVLILLLADTGTRLDEALSLRWSDVDFNNLLITVTGKGDKQRIVPFSLELRKHLFKFKHGHELVFATRDGGKLHSTNVWRNTHALCNELGIHAPERLIHALRHSFATHFIRQGGNVFLLQKSLGHTTLDMSQRYCHMATNDLQAVHQKVSLLSR
jgi:integrase/recombinase XerD